MKRYFQPVGKDGSTAKKPTPSPLKKDDNNDDKTSGEDSTKKEPLKFLTWNANSFLLRVKNDFPDFSNFISAFDPDIIAIQVTLPINPFPFFLF